jgi:hypothetical protein
VTSPTRYLAGIFARKRRTAPCAAPSRVGLTSSADIEPDMSTASTIDACSLETWTCTCGRASAVVAHVRASSTSSGGTIARQRRVVAATEASTSMFV